MYRKTIHSLRTNSLIVLCLLALNLSLQAQGNAWISLGYEGQTPDFSSVNQVIAARNFGGQTFPEFNYLQGINASAGGIFQNNFIEAGYSFMRQTEEAPEGLEFNRGIRAQVTSTHVKLGYANLERSNLYAFGGILQRDQFQLQTHRSPLEMEEDDVEWFLSVNEALWSAGAFIRIQLGALAFEPYYLWPLRGLSTASLQPLEEELSIATTGESNASFRPGGFGFRVSLLLSGPVRDHY